MFRILKNKVITLIFIIMKNATFTVFLDICLLKDLAALLANAADTIFHSKGS